MYTNKMFQLLCAKIRIMPVLAMILTTVLSCSGKQEITVNQAPMNWKYDCPGTKFWEGLPIGTGRFGAMIPGALDHEVIAFNDETLWTGGPYNSNNPEGPEILNKVREHAMGKNWKAADDEAKRLFGDPMTVQFYQPMGRLNIRFDGHDPTKASGYMRSLNMDSALVDIGYTLDGVKYFRRVFASFPDQVIVYRLEANKKGKINFSTWLTSLQPSAVAKAAGNEITMEGSTISEKPNEIILPPQMRWQSKLKVVPEGGKLTIEGDKVIVSDANALTLILAGATNWVNWNDISANEKQRCSDYITKASGYSYQSLLNRHLDDYCPLFSACRLDLGPDNHPTRTTTQSMEAIRSGEHDYAYEARYFQYGRYLLLAAARENTLAFNNHNMWLNDLDGRWRGRWTLNINIQECYWPVENTHLPRINESLLLFTENLAQSGARTAKEHFGCRGWCTGHGTDGWFMTTPTDNIPFYGMWQWGGHWIMQQLYDHYTYSLEVAYLKRIYPLLKGSVEFCLDFLVEEPESGYMVTCPSTSPENSFFDDNGNRIGVSYGSAGDIQIVRLTLRNFIEACTTLNSDKDIKEQAMALLVKLPPHKVGHFGQLQEWFYDFRESEVTHRHTSHLFALYPDDDITVRRNPELANAAKVVLERRGDRNLGWSGAWKICQFARLENPEKAYSIFHKMLADISIHPSAEDSNITPSFEGNQAIQGITAGVAEMLMQSHSGEISLLPALPSCWQKGAVKGFRARGGYDVDIAWDKGALTKAVIKANHDGTCRLRTKTPVKISSSKQPVKIETVDESCVSFVVKVGERYIIETVF